MNKTSQINLPYSVFPKFRNLQKKVDKNDLAKDGFPQYIPHITLFYGLNKVDKKEFKKIANLFLPTTIILGKTKFFKPHEDPDACVLYISIKNPSVLKTIHTTIQSNMDVQPESFMQYTPHVTLAYIKKDAIEKYTDMNDLDGIRFIAHTINVGTGVDMEEFICGQ